MNTKLAVLYLAVVLIAGCVPSLHPIYTKKDVIFEEKLLGQWQEGDNIWTFEQGSDPNSYKLNINIDGEDGEFKAYLTKINKSMYLDLFPEEVEIQANDYYKMHLIPVHTFMKVVNFDPNLQIQAINPEFISELLEKSPDAVKHERIHDGDSIILTASTQELRKFITKYENEKDFFGDITSLETIVSTEPKEKSTETNKKKIKNERTNRTSSISCQH